MIVRTQAEVAAALANPRVTRIEIRSEPGVWLRVGDSRGKSVVAWGSSSVVARDSSSVVALGSSSVVARGNSSVEAWGSSSVEALGSSSVVAWGSSSVEAWGASSTRTYGPPVKAGTKCAVFVHRAGVNVEGGVVIDVTNPDKEPGDWCDWNGVEVTDGQALVYKAVDDMFTTSRGFDYSPGSHLTAPDWRDDGSCGSGLHFGPTPRHAKGYFAGATRFVKVAIPLDKARPISGGVAKIKAASCLVLGEVDINGKAVSR